MERLTCKYEELSALRDLCTFDKNNECIDCKSCAACCEEESVNDCAFCPIQDAFDKLAEYEDAEEKGLLLRLPCNAGDPVYRINPGAMDPIIEMMVQTIAIRHHATSVKSVCLYCIDLKDLNESFYLEKAFGNDVFFTREEAEAALKKMQEGAE